MKLLKNILVGFAVSFIGSIPLGYLNIAGFYLYSHRGLTPTIWYLLGVVSVEVFVIYFTLVFANRLTENKKLMRFIEVFSIIFMLALAVYFYMQIPESHNVSVHWQYNFDSPFLGGLGLSCLNFMQIPFWTGWNLYLLNNNYVDSEGSRKFFYISGTGLGTFAGMLVFILSLNALDMMEQFSGMLSFFIALVFAIMAIVQIVKYYRKYHRAKK